MHTRSSSTSSGLPHHPPNFRAFLRQPRQKFACNFYVTLSSSLVFPYAFRGRRLALNGIRLLPRLRRSGSLHRAVRPGRPRLPRPRAHAAGDARLRTFPAPSGGVLDASPAAPLTRQTLTPLPCLCACCELNFGRRRLNGSPSTVLRCFDSSPPRHVGSSTSRLPPSPSRPRRSHRRVAFYAPSVSTASSSPSSVIALSTGFPAVPPGRPSSPTGNHCNSDS